MKYLDHFQSPIGVVEISANDQSIMAIRFVDQPRAVNSNALTNRAITQLTEYFTGQRQCFDLPLGGQGTAFQQSVWRALSDLPYGQTCSYQDIAQALDNSRAVRAVGAANGRNPISIVVPCHRVIGANGTLTGYAGGVDRKAWLLKHEGALLF